jgi:uncharacterized protein
MNECGLTDGDILLLQNVFATHPKVLKVILFGSRAMGNYRLGSDIDFAIISDGITYAEQLQLAVALENLGLLYKIDIQDMSKIADPEVLDHINRVGKVFYRR